MCNGSYSRFWLHLWLPNKILSVPVLIYLQHFEFVVVRTWLVNRELYSSVLTYLPPYKYIFNIQCSYRVNSWTILVQIFTDLIEMLICLWTVSAVWKRLTKWVAVPVVLVKSIRIYVLVLNFNYFLLLLNNLMDCLFS